MSYLGKIVCFDLMFTLFCITCSALGSGDYTQLYRPLVYTNSGRVTGIFAKTGDNIVSAFLGIPYAQPPVDEKRFKEPIPVEKWEGIYDASSKSPACIQGSQNDLPWVSKLQSSEDCLYLNVWVPGECKLSQVQETLLPVMIWIHGGGFYSGSSSDDLYDGTPIASLGKVIVVSMNYRVASFGFFYSGTKEAPGNVGMLDQVLALRWIKENIKSFGGDPNQITLFGESAGSVSVGMHIISPMTRDLFNKAIMQSSSPYHPQANSDLTFSKLKSNMFASALGCADDKVNLMTEPDKVVECMKGIDPVILAQAEGTIVKTLPYFFLPNFGDEFMPEPPLQALESGNYKKMPLLIGNNKNEGSVFLHQMLPEYFGQDTALDLNKAVGQIVISGIFQNSTNPPPNVVAEFYLGNVSDDDTVGVRNQIQNAFGDFAFVCPSVLFAEKFHDAYYYVFTHRPSNTKWGEWMGATHFEDVAFVFGMPLRYPELYTPEEVKFSRDIINKWTSFARSGNPVTCKSNEYWPKYSEEKRQYRQFHPSDLNLGRGPQEDQCKFWKSYFTSSR